MYNEIQYDNLKNISLYLVKFLNVYFNLKMNNENNSLLLLR